MGNNARQRGGRSSRGVRRIAFTMTAPIAQRLFRPVPDGFHSRLAPVTAAALAALFITGHVLLLKETLDGIDSTNFILAIDGYDPSAHQPHPPGFPVHVALGRLVTSAYRAVVPASEHDLATAAASLRIWSALSGTLTVAAMMWLAIGTGLSRSRAALATALLTLSPLFWVTAMRPLSDVPGLLFAISSQALALAGFNRLRRSGALPNGDQSTAFVPTDYRWLAAAFVAGVAIGVRVQTSVLTLPLLVVLVTLYARRAGRRVLLPIIAAFLLGVFLWAVPLLLTLGGPSEYVRLLSTVAMDDVRGVEMLATSFSPRLVLAALARTFLIPWGSAAAGSLVLVASIVGGFELFRSNRRTLGVTLVIGAPYLTFHLLFQETASIRYALPVVPAVALLVAGAPVPRHRWLWVPILVLLIGGLAKTTVAAGAAYAATESPVARALADAGAQARDHSETPTLAFHHSVERAARGASWPGPILAAPVRYEWLQLAKHWLSGNRATIWFLGDGRRSDLALIDPAARRTINAYHWPIDAAPLLGGIQPPRVVWYEIKRPGWFLTRGWALTPEIAGVSTRDARQPGTDGAVGYIKRRSAPALMLIGGRNLGGPCDTAARVEVFIDGQQRASWTVQSRAAFTQWIPLEAGTLAGAGDYAHLRVVARDVAPEQRIVDVAVEQFDLQSAEQAMVGFGRGWHMPEIEETSGLAWRWTEEAAELRVESFGRDVELLIRGESPLRYFQQAPRVVIRVGDTEIASFLPTADFDWSVPLSGAILAAAGGLISIETDRSFVPDATTGNGDQRRLALRIFSASVVAKARPPA
jgi:hypothetical protein